MPLLYLEIRATGALIVDCHHTIEDVGIVLGEAIKKAVGDKKTRYSALANVSISVCTASNAFFEYDIILDFLIKSSTLNGEKNFAVPLVGNT